MYRAGGPEEMRSVGEIEFVQGLAAASPNRFRGIRHSVTWDPHPEVENTAAHKREGQLASDHFRAGSPDDVLHRAVRPQPLYVRKQLPRG
jgi:hypothetical protein